MKGHLRLCIAMLSGITLVAAAMGPIHAQTFSGNWSTSTDKVGWFYDMTLAQTGANVTGNYTVTTPGDQQNTKGQITGTVSGSTLKFTWNQETRKQGQIQANAFTGTGEFTLCADGNHFMGPYTSTGGPALPALPKDLWNGTWIGTKKGTAAGMQDKLATAFKTWLGSVGVANASLAVMQKGCLVGQYGFGNRRTTTSVPVASLTKAITAMCIANLVDAGKLAYADTVSTRLATFFKSATIADTDVNKIKIADLLRHQSGFPGGVGMDAVLPNAASADETLVKAALGKKLDRAPGSGTWDQSHYSNVNYALLGMVIKQVTGQNYETFCRQAVLTPSRFHGYQVDQPHIGTGIQAMGAFGGWEITAEQYADFIDSHYRRMSAGADKFMSDSLTTNATKGVAYGLGVVTVKSATSSARNYWHFGNWTASSNIPTTPQQFSSYFGMWDNDLLAVVALDQDKTNGALDCAMVTAQGKTC